MKKQRIKHGAFMRKALKRADKWYKARELGVQTGKIECANEYEDGTRCVIGAMLTKKQIKRIHRKAANYLSLCATSSILNPKLDTEDEAYVELDRLQELHDGGCTSMPWRGGYAQKFREHFKSLKKKYGVK